VATVLLPAQKFLLVATAPSVAAEMLLLAVAPLWGALSIFLLRAIMMEYWGLLAVGPDLAKTLTVLRSVWVLYLERCL
jgi:hypothetical protein